MMEHCSAMEAVIDAFEEGALSAESPLSTDRDCPFSDIDPGLREFWLDGFYTVRTSLSRAGKASPFPANLWAN